MGLITFWCNAMRVAACAALFSSLPVSASEQSESRVAVLLSADTEVRLKLLEPVASNTHQHKDRFALEVVEPVIVDGLILVPAGTAAEGEVVHAQKGGFGGRGGELILVSRSLRVHDQTIRLRSFSAANGQERVNLAVGLSFAVVGIFVKGKDISLSEGTEVFAKIAADSLVVPTQSIQMEPSVTPSPPPKSLTEIESNDVIQQ